MLRPNCRHGSGLQCCEALQSRCQHQQGQRQKHDLAGQPWCSVPDPDKRHGREAGAHACQGDRAGVPALHLQVVLLDLDAHGAAHAHGVGRLQELDQLDCAAPPEAVCHILPELRVLLGQDQPGQRVTALKLAGSQQQQLLRPGLRHRGSCAGRSAQGARHTSHTGLSGAVFCRLGAHRAEALGHNDLLAAAAVAVPASATAAPGRCCCSALPAWQALLAEQSSRVWGRPRRAHRQLPAGRRHLLTAGSRPSVSTPSPRPARFKRRAAEAGAPFQPPLLNRRLGLAVQVLG